MAEAEKDVKQGENSDQLSWESTGGFVEVKELEEFSDEDLGIGMERYGDMTRDERITCMKKIKERYKDTGEMMANSDILKFCRGQLFKFDDVVPNFDYHLEWRKRIKFDEPDTEHFNNSKIRGSGQSYMAGFSKKGNTIIVTQPQWSQRSQHAPKTYLTYEQKDFEECHAHGYKAFAIPVRHLMGDARNYIIIDFTGYWLTDFSRAQSRIESESFMKNFPEMMEKTFIVNAPFGVQTTFNILKGFLAPMTRKKFKFVNSPKDLLDYIDADVLEKKFGGNHEPYCSETLDPKVTAGLLIEDLRDKNVSDHLQNRLKFLDCSSIVNVTYPTMKQVKNCRLVESERSSENKI